MARSGHSSFLLCITLMVICCSCGCGKRDAAEATFARLQTIIENDRENEFVEILSADTKAMFVGDDASGNHEELSRFVDFMRERLRDGSLIAGLEGSDRGRSRPDLQRS